MNVSQQTSRKEELMTQNQILYQRHLEDVRSHQANELETNRANVARETETHRNNVAIETETNRHNVVTENETHQHNYQSRLLQSRQLDIQAAHNREMENISKAQLAINERLGYQNLEELKRSNRAQEELKRQQTRVTENYNKQQAQIAQYNAQTQRAYTQGQLEEQNRHNLAQESLTAQQTNVQKQIADINATISRMNAETAARSTQINEFDALTRRKKMESDVVVNQINANASYMNAQANMLKSAISAGRWVSDMLSNVQLPVAK